MCKKMLAMWALSLTLLCLGHLVARGAAGEVDAGFLNSQNGANNAIRALAVQPDGKIVIGGDFTTVNEVGRNRIARLNADGSLDTSFMNGLAGADALVRAIAVQPDGKIVIVGNFLSVNGAARGRIARLNPDGSLDSYGNGQAGADASVAAVLAQADGKIVVAGQFAVVNGFGSIGIARLNTDGAYDKGFVATTSGAVFGVTAQTDGKLIIGGQFTTVNGTARNNIARLNTDGTLDTGFLNGQSGTDNPVVSIAVQTDGKIVIGGGFTNVNGAARTRIARLNPAGTLDTAFGNGLAGASNSVLSIALQTDGKAVIGGQFTTLNTVARGGIARLNTDGTLDTAFGSGLAGANTAFVRAVAAQGDGRVLLGGDFTTVNTVTRNRSARLNSDGTLDTSFLNSQAGTNGSVLAVAAQPDGKVLIGGFFSTVNGFNRTGIARVNRDGTVDPAFLNVMFDVDFSGVNAIALQNDGKIVIGGGFFAVNGVERNFIARLNADGTLDTAFGNGQTGATSPVNAVAVQTDGKIIIGGIFNTINNVARGGIARLNADGTLDAAFGNGQAGAQSNDVRSLALQTDGKILLSGQFTAVNGVARNRIARLNLDGTLDTAFGNGLTGADNPVLALALQTDGKVLIGGTFTSVNGVARNRIARLNADGALDTAFGNGQAGASSQVSALAAQTDGKVVIGGAFTTVNGIARIRIARLNADGTLDTAFGNGQPGADAIVRTVAAQNDGKVIIGGDLFAVNGVPRNRVARLLGGIGISGRISAVIGASFAGVPVTLSGASSQVVFTDNNGNYSFPTLPAGGNYSVIPNSPAFVFSPARMDFTNLAADQTQNYTAPANAVPPAAPPLTDDFSGAARDPNKWNLGVLSQPPGSFDPNVTVSQATGRLVITPVANQAGLHYGGYVAVNNFDLSGGQASVELAQAGTNGAQSLFSIGTDFNNFSRFLVVSPAPNAPLKIEPVIDGVKQAPFEGTMPMLMFQIVFNGQVFLNVAIPYDPVAHRFLRFRHLARDANNNPANLLVFETSPDASAYTERARGDLGERSVSAITVELAGGTAGSAGNPGPVIFDNLVTQVINARFALAAVTVSEGAGQVTLNVTRTGLTNLSGTMEYSTSDGAATQRTRYVAAAGALSFAPGETSKSFQILLQDNALVDGSQDFNVFLGPGQGMGVNGPGRVVVTVTDNDSPPITTNPLETPAFFVTEQYYDFLSRQPDAPGLAFWTNEITGPCGGNPVCISQRRWQVSNAFFFEQEFQQTGSYVYRVYRAAYGNQQPFPNSGGDMDAHPFCAANPNNCALIRAAQAPSYAKFVNDRARVVGGAQLAASQLSYAQTFANRAEFRQKYPPSLSAGAQFVDAVLATLTSFNVNLTSQRAALITLYDATAGDQNAKRGAVLYRLADDNAAGNPINNRVFIDAEYSRAFVLTQYFGYLRRDPDMPGLNFWLAIINRFPLRAATGQNAMVCAFITSGEYQSRFSLITPRTDAECPTPP